MQLPCRRTILQHHDILIIKKIHLYLGDRKNEVRPGFEPGSMEDEE